VQNFARRFLSNEVCNFNCPRQFAAFVNFEQMPRALLLAVIACAVVSTRPTADIANGAAVCALHCAGARGASTLTSRSCALSLRGGLDSSLSRQAHEKEGMSAMALHLSMPTALVSDDSLVMAGGGQDDKKEMPRSSVPNAGIAAGNPGLSTPSGNLPRPLPSDKRRYTEPLPIPANATGPTADFFRKLQDRWMGEVVKKNEHHLGRASKIDSRGGAVEPDGGSWISRMEEAQANIKPLPDSKYRGRKLLEDEPEYFPDRATEKLWWSCVEGNVNATRVALESGAESTFNHSRYHQRTALHYAAAMAEGDEEQIVLLINAGADVNAEDEVGCRPLHFAAETWDPDKVRALVKAGAEKHHQNGQGFTPFQIAKKMYDICKEPGLQANPDYDPQWEIDMMDLLRFPGATDYPVHFPLHSSEIAAFEKEAREQESATGVGGGGVKEKRSSKKRAKIDLSDFE